MPAFDKTGPVGQGPMTGRKMGICSGNISEDEAANIGGYGYGFRRGGRGAGRGGGRGFGRGAGRGFGRGLGGMNDAGPQNDESVKSLSDQINGLKDQITQLEKRLESKK